MTRTFAMMACFLALIGCTAQIPMSFDPAALDDATLDAALDERFYYAPPEPTPDRVENASLGRMLDANYFLSYPHYDRSYTPEAREKALVMAQGLSERAADLSHEQFVLAVAEIVALADNAHSVVNENAFRKNTPRIPLRTYIFADGLHVLWSDPTLKKYLGARIDHIEGKPVKDVQKALRKYSGGPERRRDVYLLSMLESPALLQAAGLASSKDRLTLSGVLIDGTPFEDTIMAEDRGPAAWVSTTARTLFPREPGGRMESLLKIDGDLPPSLAASSELYDARDIAGGGYYLSLASVSDPDEGSLKEYLSERLAEISERNPEFIVIDLRMNGGGDYTLAYNFARSLPDTAARAPIYVLTSPFTFSAAITIMATIKDAGGDQVKIVGEEAGDRLDFWAEGGTFFLPNSFVAAHYASGRHRYDAECANWNDCYWLNARYPARVSSIKPDISAPWTFSAYKEGRDPALEAVFSDMGE